MKEQIRSIMLTISMCLIFSCALLAAAPAQPTALAAGHRAGQTFITWTERADLSGEQYRIYRHTAPIAAANLYQATRLETAPEDSSFFYADRYDRDASGDWQTRYLERYVIADNASPLAAGTGLLVWTLAGADFGGGATTGAAYYAVTTVDSLGAENTGDFSAANSIGPVAEGVADPLPVHTAVNVGERGHLYIQYMDLRQWNPTFHAPHLANLYYGLNPAVPAVACAIQYAYPYVVYEPENNPVGAVPAYLSLHGWGGNSYEPLTSDPDPWGWPVYKIYPLDIGETWYFGFARNHDYRQNLVVEAGDTIVNFTEQRLLRMLYDLVRQPPRQGVDINRIYVYGGSMGGSGTLALALRYPNVFAAAYASQPMTDYANYAGSGAVDWRYDVAVKWGGTELNLPVEIAGPSGLAAHLTRYNGTGVWDWQDHQAMIQQRLADNIVPFGVAHGMNDLVIPWSTQGQPAYGAFNNSRQMWGGAVTEADHTWQGFNGLPPNLAMDEEWMPFAGFSVVRDETVPGLANASGNLEIPPAQTGGYNLSIEWSASWQNWDNLPVDTTNRWEISLRTTDYSTQTADITPRRAQGFRAPPGASVNWVNRSLSDGSAVQSGTVFADANGLVTVRNVLITGDGNRLSLTLGSYDPGDITNGAPVAADFDGDRLTDPALYDGLSGTWVIYLSSAGYVRIILPAFLGGPGWIAMAADYDGDGKADPAVCEIVTGNWSVKMTTAEYRQVDMPDFLGGESWAPVAADFDGDGVGDPAVYEEVSATWQLMLSGSDYTYLIVTLGRPGTAMLAADFDGDRLADPAQYLAGNWYIRFSSSGYQEQGPFLLTLAGATPSVGDFDGDRLADPAMVFQGHWTIWFSSGGYQPCGPYL